MLMPNHRGPTPFMNGPTNHQMSMMPPPNFAGMFPLNASTSGNAGVRLDDSVAVCSWSTGQPMKPPPSTSNQQQQLQNDASRVVRNVVLEISFALLRLL